MKRIPIALAMILLATSQAMAVDWAYNYDYAIRVAREKNKTVLINFTGSDWCGWCIKLKKEVFDTKEFKEYADENLILLEIDFPKKKWQDPVDARANAQLAEKFSVSGFPTLFVVDGQGKALQELGYVPGGPKAFINEMNRSIKPDAVAAPGNARISGTPAAAPTARPAAPDRTPAVSPLAMQQAPKVVYDKLILKGITDSSSRPMALINNKTFSPGDSYKVQVGSETVRVSCISIASDHVMVKLEGEAEPRKLALGEK